MACLLPELYLGEQLWGFYNSYNTLVLFSVLLFDGVLMLMVMARNDLY